MRLSPGPCGVCSPQHWSSCWAEPGLSFCFAAVQLPQCPFAGGGSTNKNRSLLAASPASCVPQPFSISRLLCKPQPCGWYVQKKIEWTGPEQKGKESNADFVHPFSPIASTWAVDHSRKRSCDRSPWQSEGGEALLPSPPRTPANFPVSSCPEGPLQTGEQIEVVVFPLAAIISGFCDVDLCPAISGLR